MNDPTVVKEAAKFVRVIVRRPHAYFFLKEKFDTGGSLMGTMTGVTFGDGTVVPLPGIYVLNTEGVVENQVAIASSDAKEDLLNALRQ